MHWKCAWHSALIQTQAKSFIRSSALLKACKPSTLTVLKQHTETVSSRVKHLGTTQVELCSLYRGRRPSPASMPRVDHWVGNQFPVLFESLHECLYQQGVHHIFYNLWIKNHHSITAVSLLISVRSVQLSPETNNPFLVLGLKLNKVTHPRREVFQCFTFSAFSICILAVSLSLGVLSVGSLCVQKLENIEGLGSPLDKAVTHQSVFFLLLYCC